METVCEFRSYVEKHIGCRPITVERNSSFLNEEDAKIVTCLCQFKLHLKITCLCQFKLRLKITPTRWEYSSEKGHL